MTFCIKPITKATAKAKATGQEELIKDICKIEE